MADTSYIASLSGQLREIVVGCYVSGLKHTYRELSIDDIVLLNLMLKYHSSFSRLFTSSILQWIVHHASSNLDRVGLSYTYQPPTSLLYCLLWAPLNHSYSRICTAYASILISDSDWWHLSRLGTIYGYISGCLLTPLWLNDAWYQISSSM